MVLNKLDNFERLQNVSLRDWKHGEKKVIEFLDDGREVTTVNGRQVIFKVRVGNNKTLNLLWVRPNGSLHIGLNDFLPLKGKTLAVSKEVLGGDVVKGTRYRAKVIENRRDRRESEHGSERGNKKNLQTWKGKFSPHNPQRLR